MMPAVQASRAGNGGGDLGAGVEVADPGGVEVGEELVEPDGDHDGGAAAACLGQRRGGDGFDELAERVSVADLGGQ